MSKAHHSCLVFAAGLALGIYLTLAFQARQADLDRQIVRIVDGDTVRIARGENVRLLGFDAPEPTRRAHCSSEQELGVLAKRQLGEMIESGQVALLMNGKRDRWGRPLAMLTIDGEDIATRAATAGWGKMWDGHGGKPDWCRPAP